jgi:hypothetical protein
MYRNGAYTSVGNAQEEAEKRADGWTDWYTDQDRMNGVAKPAEQVVKDALAESMRLDPPPVVTYERDAMIPAQSLDEMRDEAPKAKRKYTRKAK